MRRAEVKISTIVKADHFFKTKTVIQLDKRSLTQLCRSTHFECDFPNDWGLHFWQRLKQEEIDCALMTNEVNHTQKNLMKRKKNKYKKITFHFCILCLYPVITAKYPL